MLLWGKYEDIAKVCRKLALCYGILKHPKKIPDPRVFQRVVNRFLETGLVKVAPVQRTKTTRNEENVKEMGGGHFKAVLKKRKRNAIEE